MRTTVTLDDDIFEAAQSLADASGKRLGVVISELARKGLKSSYKQVNHNGLPVFKVAEDAPIIPGNRARDILSEEM